MTAAEIVGTVLTALVLGTINGAWLARAWQQRRHSVRGIKEQQILAYRDWLAAQKVLTRTSLVLVAAYRSFGSTDSDTPSHDFKRGMFLRSRASWNDALSELDRAEASLVVWCEDSQTREELSELTRSAKHIVQIVLQRDLDNFDALANELRSRDEQAVAYVQSLAEEIRRRPNGLIYIFDRLVTCFQSMVNRWQGKR